MNDNKFNELKNVLNTDFDDIDINSIVGELGIDFNELEKQVKARNAARLAPIEAAQKARIDNWIAANPGKTKEDYWKWQEKRQSGPEVDIYNGQLCGFGNDKPGCAGSERARERRLKRERNR